MVSFRQYGAGWGLPQLWFKFYQVKMDNDSGVAMVAVQILEGLINLFKEYPGVTHV